MGFIKFFAKNRNVVVPNIVNGYTTMTLVRRSDDDIRKETVDIWKKHNMNCRIEKQNIMSSVSDVLDRKGSFVGCDDFVVRIPKGSRGESITNLTYHKHNFKLTRVLKFLHLHNTRVTESSHKYILPHSVKEGVFPSYVLNSGITINGSSWTTDSYCTYECEGREQAGVVDHFVYIQADFSELLLVSIKPYITIAPTENSGMISISVEENISDPIYIDHNDLTYLCKSLPTINIETRQNNARMTKRIIATDQSNRRLLKIYPTRA